MFKFLCNKCKSDDIEKTEVLIEVGKVYEDQHKNRWIIVKGKTDFFLAYGLDIKAAAEFYKDGSSHHSNYNLIRISKNQSREVII